MVLGPGTLFCGANFASGSGVLWSLDVWVVLLFFWWEAGVFLFGAVAFVIFFSTSCALSY
jgi:hypothetical protein